MGLHLVFQQERQPKVEQLEDALIHPPMTTIAIPPRWWITVAALFVSAVLLSPFYWVLVGSFMTPAELFGGHMTLWPRHFAFENWSVALARLWPHIQNSLMVSAVASIGTLMVTAPAAYGIVWRKPRGRKTLMAFMLMTQMLPAIVFVIPLFIVFTKINLVNTLPGLILADMTFTIPFALIMLSAYMKDLPYELVEAALVDGAGQTRAFLMIVLPMTLPGLITVGVFSFLIPWGDLIFALSLITDANLQPLTLELYKAMGQYGIDWGFLLPGSVLTAIPAVLFVVAASRFIVAGVTRGAIK
jgi:multiple sugar transport system permease protein